MWGALDDLGEGRGGSLQGLVRREGEVTEADGTGQVKQREDHGSSYEIGEWVDEAGGGRWNRGEETEGE